MAAKVDLWQKSRGPVTTITGLVWVTCDIHHWFVCDLALPA